jgi:hypothetical protein
MTLRQIRKQVLWARSYVKNALDAAIAAVSTSQEVSHDVRSVLTEIRAAEKECEILVRSIERLMASEKRRRDKELASLGKP